MITASTLLKDPLIENSLLTDRPVQDLKPLQIWLFIWQCKAKGQEMEGRQVINQLLTRIELGVYRGEFKAPYLSGYRLPKARVHMTCHELAAMLARVSPVRRKALLFTADSGIPPMRSLPSIGARRIKSGTPCRISVNLSFLPCPGTFQHPWCSGNTTASGVGCR